MSKTRVSSVRLQKLAPYGDGRPKKMAMGKFFKPNGMRKNPVGFRGDKI